ncbi:troponin I, fast skeletal muscle, partial [Harpia harpyja]
SYILYAYLQVCHPHYLFLRHFVGFSYLRLAKLGSAGSLFFECHWFGDQLCVKLSVLAGARSLPGLQVLSGLAGLHGGRGREGTLGNLLFSHSSHLQKKRRAATARRQHLKSAMLQLAATEIEREAAAKEVEKQNYLAEHCPPLSLPGSMQELQELCKKLHAKIESVDEERYDTEVKLQKTNKELEDLSQKLFDLRGKFKRPPLRRVRMSADAMLRALLGSKHKVCMDLRANLKQVKKEDTEKEKDLRDVGDWRKNIEEKSGMEGRKKMFEAGES